MAFIRNMNKTPPSILTQSIYYLPLSYKKPEESILLNATIIIVFNYSKFAVWFVSQGLLGLCCSIETRDRIEISNRTAVLFE